MEQIFVKCEPESDDELNDHLFSEEEIKVREIVAIDTSIGKAESYSSSSSLFNVLFPLWGWTEIFLL